MERKTIQLTVQLTSGGSSYDMCEYLTNLVMNSVIGSHLYNGEVIDCKVIDVTTLPLQHKRPDGTVPAIGAVA